MKRTLGRSEIEVSALGMGCWAIGGPYWSGETPHGWGDVDDEESIRAIHKALDLGVNLFDLTADDLSEIEKAMSKITVFGNRY